MTLETKYNINDVVWYIHDNKVYCTNIYGIRFLGITHVSDNGPVPDRNDLEYKVDGYTSGTWLKEYQLFSSKEELLKTL